jgi:hypothetical protein
MMDDYPLIASFVSAEVTIALRLPQAITAERKPLISISSFLKNDAEY